VFLPEPMPANRELFQAARAAPALIPVPVINPALAVWREHLDECRAAAKVRAVRIFPAYHRYTLRHRNLGGFMEALDEAGIRLIVCARLEDERNRYAGLKVKGVPAGELARFLARFREFHVLCTGLDRAEVAALAKDHDNFSAELCFCEYMDTVADLLTALPASRLMLGTNTPLLTTLAETAKLRHARVSARVRERIGSGNARRFFSL
ncbi:MAG: amidohydrolase family protein, partial [Opitutaceae bacterium]